MPNKRTVLVSLVFGLVALTLLATAQPASAGVDDIVVGQKTIMVLQETGATQDDIEYVRAVIVNLIDDSPNHFKTYVEQSTRDYIVVRVYRNNPAVLAGEAAFWPPGGGGGIGNDVRIDLADNDVIISYLEGFNDDQKETVSLSTNKWILAHEFGHLNFTRDPQLKENDVLTDIGAGWQRLDYYGYCRISDWKTIVPFKVGTNPGVEGVLNVTDFSDAREGAGGVLPDELCGSGSVGGIAEPPDVEALPADTTNPASTDHTGLAWTIAGAAIGAILLVAAGMAWFARRRLS